MWITRHWRWTLNNDQKIRIKGSIRFSGDRVLRVWSLLPVVEPESRLGCCCSVGKNELGSFWTINIVFTSNMSLSTFLYCGFLGEHSHHMHFLKKNLLATVNSTKRAVHKRSSIEIVCAHDSNKSKKIFHESKETFRKDSGKHIKHRIWCPKTKQ